MISMQTLDCIRQRRSIRRFLDKDVPDNIIIKALNAGLHAPSSRDCQPWHFVVVREKQIRKKLADIKGEDNIKPIMSAPVVVIVCVDIDASPSRWIEDGVCATENLLLAAYDLGLGSVYITGSKQSKPEIAAAIQKILGLPSKVMPVTILPLGYPHPKEQLQAKELRALDEVLHLEGW
ncbi:hypothetical protein GF351_03745 [Candidatus Woesearchaeota archaeon]|nr:hypothetical protein [Candidatus Woesearchaeota archaeon]